MAGYSINVRLDLLRQIFNIYPKGTFMATKNYQQLQKEIAALQERATEQRKKELAAVIAEIKKKMDAYGISMDDLKSARVPAKRGRKAASAKAAGGKRGPAPVKYRDSSTGDTWSGRGRLPRWLAAYEEAGRKKEEFAV